MFGLGRQGRGRTRDSRAGGARRAVAGALREAAIETAKDGIRNATELAGKAIGAGLGVAATAAVGATGLRPTPLIAVGAAYAGSKFGGMGGKALESAVDKATPKRTGAGAVDAGTVGGVMAAISTVLHALEQARTGARQATHTIDLTLTYHQGAARGTSNRHLAVAEGRYKSAPPRIAEGMAEIKSASETLGRFLIRVASGRAG